MVTMTTTTTMTMSSQVMVTARHAVMTSSCVASAISRVIGMTILSHLNDHNNGSKIDTIHTSNSDFTCSYQPPWMLEALDSTFGEDQLLELLLSQESKPNGKENNRKMKRSRKQSQPRQIIRHHNYQRYLIYPDLSLQNVRNQKFKINSKSIQSHKQQRSASQRMFKCHLCPKYAPARGKTHRPYHSRASLTLHMLWRHKRGSWLAKSQVIKDNLTPTISSVTLKATFFTNPNYRYDR